MNKKKFGIFIAFFIILSFLGLYKLTYNIVSIKELFYIVTSFFFFSFILLQKKGIIEGYKVELWLYIYLFFNIILFVLVKYKYFSWHYTVILITSLFFYLLIRELNHKFSFYLLELIGAISSIYGILLSSGIDILNLYGGVSGRTPSFYGNSNFFAGLLIPFIIITIAAIFISRDIKLKVLHSIVLFLNLYAMFLTRTRAAFAGLLVSLVLLLIYFIKRKKIKKFGIFLSVFIFLAVLPFVPKDYWERIKQLKNVSKGTPMFRVYTWNSSLHIISDHPLGVGPGNFRIYYPTYKSKRIFLFEGHHNAETIHAHNDFIETAVDTGFIGFFLYLAFLFGFLYLFFKMERNIYYRNRNVTDSLILFSVAIGIVGLLVDNIFSVNLKWLSSIIMLYFLIGLGMSVVKKYKKPWRIYKTGQIGGFIILVLGIFFFIGSYRRITSDKYLLRAINCSKTGVIVRSKKKNNDLAIKYFEKANGYYKRSLSLNRNNIIGIYFSGNLRMDLYSSTKESNYLTEALNYYKKVQTISPNYVQVHFLKGKTYYNLGKYEKAKTEFEDYLKQDPVDPEVYNYLAKIYDKLGLKTKKQELFKFLEDEIKENLKIKPDHKELYSLMEFNYKQLGQINKIIPTYKELLKKVGNKKVRTVIYKRIAAYYYNFDKEGGKNYFNGINERMDILPELRKLFNRGGKQ